MAFPIIPKKRSGATGSPTSLAVGELAVNTATGELFLGGDEAVLLLNPPTAAGTTATERTGDGTTVAFTFTGYNGTADGGYLVSVGGIDQPPSKYAVTSTAGGTITFVEAPTAGELISIRALVASGGGGGGSGTVTSITAGAGLDGGTITESGTISMPDVGTPQTAVGSGLVIPVISTDAQGRVTALTTVACPALTTTQIAGLATTAPAALATSAVVGLSTFAARADHQHVFPSASDVGALGATASASGDLAGNYPGPTLAAITTAQSNVGSSTQIPVISIDEKGRVTALSSASAGGNATQIQGRNVANTAPTDKATLSWNASTSQWEPQGGVYTIEMLLVAGGGSGGGAGGGGGGGVVTTTSATASPNTNYSLVIGAGGAGGVGSSFIANNGSNSTGFGLTAIGGGGGGRYTSTNNQNGFSGGSGGGAGLNSAGANNAGGAGTAGQGFAGGNANQLESTGFAAGGGGGAGAVGGDKSNKIGGVGGAGVLNAINGSSLYWAGGGGSGSQGSASVPGNGGIGGGGGGANASGGTSASTGGGSALNSGANGNTSGTGGAGGANTGGGGGAMAVSIGTAASGGSGVAILRYLGSQRGTGGTVTSSGGYTIHTFLSSGIYVG
jgi:hypothetical protein